MRKIIGYILVFFLFSCANNSKKESMLTDEETHMMSVEMKAKKITLEQLTTEKLNSYFELLKLRNEHPEFNKDIRLRLDDFSNEDLVKIDSLMNFTIENIHKVGEVTILSDSTQRMKLVYNFTSNGLRKTDSVNALITSRMIVLDGRNSNSTNIKFYVTN